MAKTLEPLRQGDLPEMGMSFWKMAGPGAIMVGVAVGSGELVLWPWITARFGAVMAWAPVIGIFLQAWINVEIGRWAIATGESAFAGLARWWGGIIYLFMFFLGISTLLPGWGRATAATVRFLIFGMDGPGPEGSIWRQDWLWSIPVTCVGILILLGPKTIYKGLERIVTLMVLTILVGLIIVAVKIGSADRVRDLAAGVFSFPPQIVTDDDFPLLRFFGALVFAGAGGFGNLFYAYYLRDKGIGMGKKFPMLTVDMRGKEERANETGYVFPDTADNQRRFRDWFRFVNYDTFVFFALLGLITLFLFVFAALVSLHPKEQGFEQGQLVWSLSGMLGQAMGLWGRYLFLIIAIFALFSTVLTNMDGTARMWTDMFHMGFPGTKKWSAGKMYIPIVLTTSLVGIISTCIFETVAKLSTLDFFFLSAAMQGVVMSIYSPVLIYINMKYLPPSARPKPKNIFFIICATLLYASFAVYVIREWVAAGLF